MKRLLKWLGIPLAVAVIAVVVLYLTLNSLAKSGIQRGASYALGVETTVEDLDLKLVRGRLTMTGLNVANPEGYDSDHLIHTGRFVGELRPASLFEDTIHVPTLELADVDVNLERRATTSNMAEVLENLERFKSEPDEDRPSKKKVKIDRIVIDGVTAHVRLSPVGGEATAITIEVPRIELDDPTGPDGAPVDELAARLVPVIVAEILKEGGPKLPLAFKADLEKSLAGVLGALEEEGKELLRQVGGLQDVFDDLRNRLPAGDEDGDGEGDGGPLKGIRDLLNGDEK